MKPKFKNEPNGPLDFSVVVPIFDEEKNISQLNREIKEVMDKLGTYEIIYVNDASRDNSLEELRKLTSIKVINLNRNYGQATALDAGFKVAKGEIVISLDGDLQNDPKDIPKLLKKLNDDNLDVVAGWRKNRKDKGGIKILTRIGRLMRNILIKDKIHDTGCTLRVYKKSVVKSLDIGGEMHRYILALLRWKGFKIGEVVVNHKKRVNGVTKYGYSKALRGFIDLLYMWFIQKYSQRPLHIFGSLGLLSGAVGFLIELSVLFGKLFYNIDVSSSAGFILGFFFMGAGIFMFTAGIIIDLLMKIYLNNSPYEKRYYVRSIREQ